MPIIPKKGEIRKPLRSNPKILVLYGPFKCGKTRAFLGLKDSLLLDTEESAEAYSGHIADCNTWAKLSQARAELEAAYNENNKQPLYRFLIFDTVSALANLCRSLALDSYYKSPSGQKALDEHRKTKSQKELEVNPYPVTVENMLEGLEYGAGYGFLKQAFFQVINAFSKYCETLILSGHMTSDFEGGSSSVSKESLLLPGNKLRIDLLGYVSAIGALRLVGNQLIASFKTEVGGTSIGASRYPKVSGREIVLSKKTGMDPNTGEDIIETFWHEVFENYENS